MSQLSTLGSPIGGSLNFQPGGNPLLGILGGPAGLAQQYGQSYNSALQTNQQNYNNILQGYQTVMNNVGNTLGQGGPLGVATPQEQLIQRQYQQNSGDAINQSINNGLGNSTAATAAQRGASFDAGQSTAGLLANLDQTYAGYEANLGQSQLNFMNSVQVPYPNGAEYNQLYQQYGQQQATAQQFALQQQAQQMALRSSGGRPSGGGVSTPQMPGMPGATQQPMGSGLTPSGFALPSNNFGQGSGNAMGNSNVAGYGTVGIDWNNVGQEDNSDLEQSINNQDLSSASFADESDY